jgi:hypothetical protein
MICLIILDKGSFMQALIDKSVALNEEINKAQEKWEYWSSRNRELVGEGIACERSLILANYYEGIYDGLLIARGLL